MATIQPESSDPSKHAAVGAAFPNRREEGRSAYPSPTSRPSLAPGPGADCCSSSRAMNVLPLPPGTNMFFAIPMLFVSAQMLIGRDKPWFPQRIDRRGVTNVRLAWLIDKIGFDRTADPTPLQAPSAAADGKTATRVIGLVCLLLGLLAAIPIPVLHIAPAAGIACSASRSPIATDYGHFGGLRVGRGLAVDAVILGSGVVALNYLVTWLHR